MHPVSSRILRHFLAVYENQGFTAAAEQIRISQPAITKSVQSLEAALGVALFDRSPKGAIPTRYADILARRLRLMDIEYRYALSEIDAAKGGGERLLRIGAGPAWYSALLPPVVRSFRAKHPDVTFRIDAGVPSGLIQKLESGDYDLVCTSLDFPNQAHLVKEPTISVRHSIVAAADHPLAKQTRTDPASLASAPWVVLADDHIGTGRILSYFAAFDCAPPKVAVETSSMTALFEFVATDMYLAHMAQVMLPHARRHGIVPLAADGTFWETPTGMIYRQTQHKAPLLVAFLDEIRAHYPQERRN